MSVKIIKDSIHGYISLDPIFSYIVDSPEFQRLKNIEQGSFRVLYPAARHDRFIHSLGTFHLATMFAQHFIENIKEDLDINIVADSEMQHNIDIIINSFCYAALLHDIGHAPFSHTTEKFFKIKMNNCVPVIDSQLCTAVKSVATEEAFQRFTEEFPGCSPSAHEIMSATLLITNANRFLKDKISLFDLELSARMVIGCTYDYNKDGNVSSDKKLLLGIKNCLIRLLNSQTVDVDKLDYITRDTQMSGFDNVPIDIERLVRSVTAVRVGEEGWLYPAFRKNALSVIDNVFRAKTEQGLWMVAHPVVLYDAELLSHCINKLHVLIDEAYIDKVFSLEALGRDGIELAGKKYFLLNDIDIGSDLRKFYHLEPLVGELYERQARRHPIWKSYYEYKYLFSDTVPDVSEEDVFLYFKPLLDYLKGAEIFVLDEDEYRKLMADSEVPILAQRAAKFLYDFFEEKKLNFNLVLLTSTNSFSPKFNPSSVFILFNNLPKRKNANYETYEFLKDSSRKKDSGSKKDSGIKEDNRRLFYLYSKDKLSSEQLDMLREKLFTAIQTQREKPRV